MIYHMTPQTYFLKSAQTLLLLLLDLLISIFYFCSKILSLLTCHPYNKTLLLLLLSTIPILKKSYKYWSSSKACALTDITYQYRFKSDGWVWKHSQACYTLKKATNEAKKE